MNRTDMSNLVNIIALRRLNNNPTDDLPSLQAWKGQASSTMPS
jgi:hypothetical protein